MCALARRIFVLLSDFWRKSGNTATKVCVSGSTTLHCTTSIDNSVCGAIAKSRVCCHLEFVGNAVCGVRYPRESGGLFVPREREFFIDLIRQANTSFLFMISENMSRRRTKQNDEWCCPDFLGIFETRCETTHVYYPEWLNCFRFYFFSPPRFLYKHTIIEIYKYY